RPPTSFPRALLPRRSTRSWVPHPLQDGRRFGRARPRRDGTHEEIVVALEEERHVALAALGEREGDRCAGVERLTDERPGKRFASSFEHVAPTGGRERLERRDRGAGVAGDLPVNAGRTTGGRVRVDAE